MTRPMTDVSQKQEHASCDRWCEKQEMYLMTKETPQNKNKTSIWAISNGHDTFAVPVNDCVYMYCM